MTSTEKEDSNALAARFKIAEKSVPPLVDQSAVAILRTNGTSTSAHGSGTLFQVADRGFVVTAAHVARQALDSGWGLAITGAKEIVPLPGDWLCSPQIGDQPDRRVGDLALYALSDDQMSGLKGRGFVRLSNTALQADVSHGFFLLLGFPVMFCDPSTNDTQKVSLGTFRFATTAARGAQHLDDFHDDVHFLLDAKDETLVSAQGEPTSLRGRLGVRVRLVDGVPGISGCSVWRIGKPKTSPGRWTQDDAVVVGVVTGVYPNNEVIKVTRWKFVTKLIHACFPELRQSLELLTMTKQ